MPELVVIDSLDTSRLPGIAQQLIQLVSDRDRLLVRQESPFALF